MQGFTEGRIFLQLSALLFYLLDIKILNSLIGGSGLLLSQFNNLPIAFYLSVQKSILNSTGTVW